MTIRRPWPVYVEEMKHQIDSGGHEDLRQKIRSAFIQIVSHGWKCEQGTPAVDSLDRLEVLKSRDGAYRIRKNIFARAVTPCDLSHQRQV
ncbi:hypothetical protein TNCV_1544021 [Trichonephila clavipes]|nr:hypothetical protein TNCV_1544021 [Trichonephila clavipes]